MTGSRDGISEKAKETLISFLNNTKIEEVQHGDCLGSDQQFNDIISEFKIKTIIHTPKISSMKSFCKGDIILPVKDYLERNRDIVDSADFLIAFPSSNQEQNRSGTWSTIRYSKK